jgi:hypothetical protein
MILVVHPRSRIRILTFYPSRIQGSKRHRIPDPDPQHCLPRMMKERILNLLNRQLARQDKLTGGTGSLSQEDEGDESDFFPVENFLEEVSDAFGMVSYNRWFF